MERRQSSTILIV